MAGNCRGHSGLTPALRSHIHKINMTKEVVYMNDPSDTTQKTIQNLFFNQIRTLSLRSCSESSRLSTFDMQFSDAWI